MRPLCNQGKAGYLILRLYEEATLKVEEAMTGEKPWSVKSKAWAPQDMWAYILVIVCKIMQSFHCIQLARTGLK